MKKIISAIIITILTVILVSCGKDSPKKAVEDFFNEIKVETFAEDILLNDDFTEEEKLDIKQALDENKELVGNIQKSLSNISSKISGEIINVDEKEESANVEISINAVDGSKFISKFISEMITTAISESLTTVFSGQELTDSRMYSLTFEILEKSLTNIDLNTIEKTYVVETKKVDGKWTILDEKNLIYTCLNIDPSIIEDLKTFDNIDNDVF